TRTPSTKETKLTKKLLSGSSRRLARWPCGPTLSTHALWRLGGPETRLRVQPPLIQPGMRFSRTRLSEALHRAALGVARYHLTVPDRNRRVAPAFSARYSACWSRRVGSLVLSALAAFTRPYPQRTRNPNTAPPCAASSHRGRPLSIPRATLAPGPTRSAPV